MRLSQFMMLSGRVLLRVYALMPLAVDVVLFLGKPLLRWLQLHQERNHRGPNVSKTGAFEGMNPTIDNPTPEYRAVVFATKELKPMSVSQFEYKSEMRQQPRRGAPVLPEELDATTQLA